MKFSGQTPSEVVNTSGKHCLRDLWGCEQHCRPGFGREAAEVGEGRGGTIDKGKHEGMQRRP